VTALDASIRPLLGLVITTHNPSDAHYYRCAGSTHSTTSRRSTMTFSDHVYATKHGVELELRVFRARGLKEGEKAPWLFWSHGGAFVFCYHWGTC